MTNTKLFLLIGTSLSLISFNTYAESCTATPDCKSLGYTETSCPDGGVKCPWDTGLMYCCSGKKCSDLGFALACTGDGEIGGASEVCDGKYNFCKCTTGYVWDVTSKSCKYSGTGLKDGLYYCNGVITGVQVGSENLVVALADLGSMYWNDASTEGANYSFCRDLKGRLPTQDELLKVYNNITTVQSKLSANGGMQFTSDWYWSSSPFFTGHYVVNPVSGDTKWYDGNNLLYVRPVLSL